MQKRTVTLNLASLNDFNELKKIMYNEEIREKEKNGLNFNRRFYIFKLLYIFRVITKIVFKREYIFLCLKENESVCGGLIVDIRFSNKRAGIGYVSIRKKDRGRGLGTTLIEETLKYLQNRGMKKVELSVNSKNEIAIKTYRKNNFLITGTIYQLPGKHFFDYIKKNSIFKRIFYKILLNEKRISSKIGEINIWWVKTNNGWDTLIQGGIDEEKDIEQMIEKEKLNMRYIKKDLVFTHYF